MSGKRIEWLDIAKGIGIFLVVYAHARAPYNSYIYNFHMPFFFLISGILYKSGGDVKTYILKKVKTLYIPFAGWNLIFPFAPSKHIAEKYIRRPSDTWKGWRISGGNLVPWSSVWCLCYI